MKNRRYLKSNERLQDSASHRRALLLGIVLSVMATPDRAAAQTGPNTPAALPKDIVLVLDNSGSLKKHDPRFLIKEVVVQFIKGWPDEARGSVVIFDKHILAIPLESRDSVNLTQLNYRGLLTNIPAAVQRAIQELKLNGRPGAARSIVLLTDGVIDTGTKAQDREVTHWLRAQLASDAASTGVKIFTVALGTGSDSQLLQELAQRTGGRYFWARQAKDLPGIFAQVSDALFAPAVLQAPLERVPQLAQVSPHTPAVDPAPSNLPQAVSPTAGSEKASIPPSNAPPPEPEPRADTSAPAPLVVPSQPLPAAPVEPGAPGVRVVYALVVVAALLVAAILALVAKHLWYRKSKRGAKSDAHAPLPMAYLFDLNGVTGHERHELDAITVIGRVPYGGRNHIVINRPTIGRVHAVIEHKHHCFWLMDQNSKNGTYVNGDPVTNPRCLTPGDRVQFHDFAFEFAVAGMMATPMTMVVHRESGSPATWAVAEEMGLDKRDRFNDSQLGDQATNPATTGYGPQDPSSRGDGENESDPDDNTKYGHHQRTPVLSATLNPNELKPNNAFDAEGLTRLTQETERRRKERNEIEQDTEIAVRQKNLAAEQQKLKIERQQEFLRLEQQQTVAKQRAEQAAQVAAIEAEKSREAQQAKITAQQQIGQPRITAERQIREAEVERDKLVRQKEIEAQQQIEVARQKSEEQSQAEAKANQAISETVKTEEEVKTAREIAAAERDKAIALVQAHREAEQNAIGVKVTAQAEKQAAEDRAEAIKIKAEAERVAFEVETFGKRLINEVINTLSVDQIAMQVKLALIQALPQIIEKSVEPMRQIDGGASLPKQAVNTALAYRVQQPLIDALLNEIGLKSGNIADIVKGALSSTIAAPATHKPGDHGEIPNKGSPKAEIRKRDGTSDSL